MENKVNDKKVKMIPLILGFILLIAGVVMAVTGVKRYTDAEKQYEIDRDNWLYNHGKMPDYPNMPGVFFGGIVTTFISIPCLIYGFSPIIIKKVKPGLKAVKDEAGNLINLFTKKQTRTCAYCGSIIEDGKTKCDNCGANLR